MSECHSAGLAGSRLVRTYSTGDRTRHYMYHGKLTARPPGIFRDRWKHFEWKCKRTRGALAALGYDSDLVAVTAAASTLISRFMQNSRLEQRRTA